MYSFYFKKSKFCFDTINYKSNLDIINNVSSFAQSRNKQIYNFGIKIKEVKFHTVIYIIEKKGNNLTFQNIAKTIFIENITKAYNSLQKCEMMEQIYNQLTDVKQYISIFLSLTAYIPIKMQYFKYKNNE